jgi:hypothetical protein
MLYIVNIDLCSLFYICILLVEDRDRSLTKAADKYN